MSTTDAIDYVFFFFGKPAFIFLYALADIVDFDFDLEVPAFFLAFMFLYKLIFSPLVNVK